jgi:hypothetical protein
MLPAPALILAFLFALPVRCLAIADTSSQPAQVPSFARHEVTRLQAHFDSVDFELRAAPTANLTSSQRIARTQLVAWLRDYRDDALFPANDRFPTRPMPFFRDSRGVLCAMAYLVQRSGRSDLVNRIARSANNATIAELSGDDGLRAWLDSVGVSAAEAGRIQPQYGGFPGIVEDTRGGNTDRLFHPAAAMAFNMAALASAAVNIKAPSRSRAWVGLVTGLAVVAAGVADNRRATYDSNPFATSNIVVGGVASAVSFVRLVQRPPAQRVDSAPRGVGAHRNALAPIVARSEGGLQFGISLRHGF